jgi:hypothetical protein
MTIERRRRGRPRTRTWMGKLGAFVNDFTVDQLAAELHCESSQVYRWARCDTQPNIHAALAIVEVARAAGVALTLEDVYENAIVRIRVRLRSGHCLR